MAEVPRFAARASPAAGAPPAPTSTTPTALALRSVGWLVAAQGITGGAQFLLSVLIARHLGAEDYGRWGFAFSFVSLLAVFADFGFSVIAVRDLARDWTERRLYLGNVLLVKGLLGAVLFALVSPLQLLLTGDPIVRALIYVMAGQALLLSFAQVLFAVFRAAERSYLETVVRGGQSLALFGGVLLLMRAGTGPVPLAIAFLAASGLACLAALGLAVRLAGPLALRLDITLCRRLLSDAWPIGLGMAMTGVYYYMDMVLLGILGQRQAVGWYAAAYLFVSGASLIVTAVRGAFLPHQARLARGPAGERSALLGGYGRLSAALALPIATGGVVAAGPLLGFLFGEEYRPATLALQVLSVNAGLMFVSSFFGSQLLVSDRQRTYLVGVGVGAVINTVLNLILIPLYSLEGAAVATVLSEIWVCGSMYWQTRRELGFSLVGVLWRPALSAAVMAALLVAALSAVPVPAALALAAAGYVVALAAVGGLASIRSV